jgi:hypothetical protein
MNFLCSNWGILPLDILAKELDRLPCIVVMKAKNLKLPEFYKYYMTVLQASKYLGITYQKTLEELKTGTLKGQCYTISTKKVWRVYMAQLLEWMKENPDKWDGRKVRPNGMEPAWLVSKIKRDWDLKGNAELPWFAEEENLAAEMSRQGYTSVQISRCLRGRTAMAVRDRLQQIDIWSTTK